MFYFSDSLEGYSVALICLGGCGFALLFAIVYKALAPVMANLSSQPSYTHEHFNNSITPDSRVMKPMMNNNQQYLNNEWLHEKYGY